MNELNKKMLDNKQKIERDYDLAKRNNNKSLLKVLIKLNINEKHKLNKLNEEQKESLSSQINKLKKFTKELKDKYRKAKKSDNKKEVVKYGTEIKEVRNLISKLRKEENDLIKRTLEKSLNRMHEIEKIINKKVEGFTNNVNVDDILRKEYNDEKNRVNQLKREEQNKFRMELLDKVNEKREIEYELKKAIAVQNKYDVKEYSNQLKDVNNSISKIKDV